MVGQNQRKTALKAILYLLPALIIILVFTVWPLFHTLRMSFYEDYNIFNKTGEGFGFSSYAWVLQDPTFHKALLNTFIYAIVTVPVSIVISLAIAILLNSGIKGSKFFHSASSSTASSASSTSSSASSESTRYSGSTTRTTPW